MLTGEHGDLNILILYIAYIALPENLQRAVIVAVAMCLDYMVTICRCGSATRQKVLRFQFQSLIKKWLRCRPSACTPPTSISSSDSLFRTLDALK